MSLVVPARRGAAVLCGLLLAVPAGAEPLSLAECTRLALQRNLSAEQARGDLRAADADVTRSRSAFLPRLSVSGSWTKPEEKIEVFQGGEFRFYDQTWSARAGGSLTLFDGLGNWFNYSAARQAQTSARSRYRQARQDVVTETERLFFEVRRQEALSEVQTKAVELSTEQLKKTQAMKDLGAATQADVLKAEVDDSNNQLARLRAERDLEIAKATLANYLGTDPREAVELVAEEPDLGEVLPLETAVDRALQRNPSLESSRAGLQASRSSVRAAKSARYPSLSLNGSTNYFNFELKDFDDEHFEWQYGISMDFTLFDGFLTKGNIRRAEADLYKARRGVESEERDVILAVRQAWLDLEIARRSIEVGERAVRSSEEDLRLAQERYRLGEGTILDVIDAQVNLTRSRTDLVGSRFDARIAQSKLRSAVGDLSIPETSE